MPLRADREVEPSLAGEVQVRRNRGGVEVEVSVDEGDPLAAGRERAEFHRVALAEVAVVVDEADAASARASRSRSAVSSIEPSETTITSISSAREPLGDRAVDHADVVDDLVPAVEDGHDDGKKQSCPGSIRRLNGGTRSGHAPIVGRCEDR